MEGVGTAPGTFECDTCMSQPGGEVNVLASDESIDAFDVVVQQLDYVPVLRVRQGPERAYSTVRVHCWVAST